jgi:hypothetical protein
MALCTAELSALKLFVYSPSSILLFLTKKPSATGAIVVFLLIDNS